MLIKSSFTEMVEYGHTEVKFSLSRICPTWNFTVSSSKNSYSSSSSQDPTVPHRIVTSGSLRRAQASRKIEPTRKPPPLSTIKCWCMGQEGQSGKQRSIKDVHVPSTHSDSSIRADAPRKLAADLLNPMGGKAEKPLAQVASNCVPWGTLRFRCDARAPGIKTEYSGPGTKASQSLKQRRSEGIQRPFAQVTAPRFIARSLSSPSPCSSLQPMITLLPCGASAAVAGADDSKDSPFG
mmetsp:Transcript_68872/g.161397  ORF Transcript_68872/g.161397 Transcript_68872/m.161397 type:complete len:237 (-) Transcript_68872:574-1284(-)